MSADNRAHRREVGSLHLNALKRSPIFFGIAVALAAIVLQVAFKDEIPLAYGICTVCHARDLLSWLVNHALSLIHI